MTQAVKWYGKEVTAEVDKIIQERVRNMARFFVRTVHELIRKPKSGRQYKVSKTGKLHTASAPGEAPAVQTGRFRQSIGYEVEREGRARYAVIVGSSVEDIPVYLEFGTEEQREDDPSIENYPKPGSIQAELGTSGMAPRPVWRPALAVLKKRIGDFLRPV